MHLQTPRISFADCSLFCVKFPGLKMLWRKKSDKFEVCIGIGRMRMIKMGQIMIMMPIRAIMSVVMMIMRDNQECDDLDNDEGMIVFSPLIVEFSYYSWCL